MISGEPIPVEKGPGDQRDRRHGQRHGRPGHAGRARRGRDDARPDRPHGERGAADPAPIQRLADVVSAYFVPAVVLVAVITFVAWASFGPAAADGPRPGQRRRGPDHRLPVCAGAGDADVDHGRNRPRGRAPACLIKNAEALEVLERVDTLVIDKTGTLTEGKPRRGLDRARARAGRIGAAAPGRQPRAGERASAGRGDRRGPLGSRGSRSPAAESFQSHTGKGVEGKVDGPVRGRSATESLLEELGIEPAQLRRTRRRPAARRPDGRLRR